MFDRVPFYDVVRNASGPLTHSQVEGFDLIIGEGEKRSTPLDHMSYILATPWWETKRTMQPVKEAYWLSEKWRKDHLRYYPFYGRGYVQLTWKANYERASKVFGQNFVSNPDLAMDPQYAVPILFTGMTEGWFTGKSLKDYLDGRDEADAGDLREFIMARHIINGTDHARDVGVGALMFEKALKAGKWLQ